MRSLKIEGSESQPEVLEVQGKLLPVLDILNNVITISNFTSAVNDIRLPDVITSNPANDTLVSEFKKWQFTVWEEFSLALLNGNILAQAQEMKELYADGITDQSVFKKVINADGELTPTTITLCDDFASQILAGKAYVEKLEDIASQIQGADKAKVAALTKLVDKLSKQFDDMEQKLTEKAIDTGKDVVVSIVDVGVAVGTKKDPIAPLAKGVAQVGSDIVKQLILTSDINRTLVELEKEWKALDDATIALTTITIIVNQLKLVVDSTSKTITSLDSIENDWQEVSDVIYGSPDNWKAHGLSAIAQWSERMCRVVFSGVSNQTVAPPST